MKVYYIYFKESKKINYLELEEKAIKKDLKELFKDYPEKIEIYKDCCNYGLFNLIYKNY